MSEEKTGQRKSHPARLALLMIGGAIVGAILSPMAGSVLDIGGAGLLIGGALGMTAGLTIELCLQGRLAVELVVATGIVSALAATIWAMRR